MSRDGQRNQHTRLRVAQLAAQLMMEHGIKDHALAKRKAARQLGVESANWLPSNEEIDGELRTYVSLFEPETHVQDLENARRQAVEVMTTLARFQPVLVGGLAQGVATRYSDIELEVYADSSKEFEQFLLNLDIAFKSEERRGRSFFTLFSQPADVLVQVSPVQSLQSAARGSSEARRRLTADQLQRLLSPASPSAADGDSEPGHDRPVYHGFEALEGDK
ncbi:MAG: hypothetical protein PHR30_10575 [Gallionellaceae bacterium]|nr:hypothetical protein [Gallionellaceae bacterium]MDD5365774.1 hypothetical protein [Gallionellaceae bacterium]